MKFLRYSPRVFLPPAGKLCPRAPCSASGHQRSTSFRIMRPESAGTGWPGVVAKELLRTCSALSGGYALMQGTLFPAVEFVANSWIQASSDSTRREDSTRRLSSPAMAIAVQCTAVAPVALQVREFVASASCSYSGGRRRSLVSAQRRFHAAVPRRRGVRLASPKRSMRTRAMYVDDDNEEYLVDAPVSMGDGFSFSGGKYSDEPGRADEWFARGKIVKAYPVEGGLDKAKDPLFGLAMGEASQTSTDSFRWFYVEEGDRKNPTVVLAHGFPSQAYSYRKVMEELSADYHVVAFDWLGFGFSDKPQPKYGFNYTTDEYATALKLLVNALDLSNFTLAVQGYFVPAALQFAKNNEETVKQLILINPPVTDRHVRLPSSLAAFSTFLLGEVFAQDPLKASDKPLTDCGPYILDEEDAMVYRRPYLTSGASGFALVALSRNLKNELKESVEATKEILSPTRWKKPVSILWGLKDRWLDFNGVEDFAKSINARLVQLPQVGHHAQEDFGEEVGKSLKSLLKRVSVV